MPEIQNNIRVRNKVEDAAVKEWVEAHNGLCDRISFPFPKMRTELLGGKIEVMKNDPRGVRLIFDDYGKYIDVEVKCSDGVDLFFRPRLEDIEKCLRKNCPYIVFHNWKTPSPTIIMLFKGDFQALLNGSSATRTSEDRDGRSYEIYDGKPYYICDSRDRPTVRFCDFQSPDDSYDSYRYYLTELFQYAQNIKSEVGNG